MNYSYGDIASHGQEVVNYLNDYFFQLFDADDPNRILPLIEAKIFEPFEIEYFDFFL